MSNMIYLFDAEKFGKGEVAKMGHKECSTNCTESFPFGTLYELQKILNEDKARLTYNWVRIFN